MVSKFFCHDSQGPFVNVQCRKKYSHHNTKPRKLSTPHPSQTLKQESTNSNLLTTDKSYWSINAYQILVGLERLPCLLCLQCTKEKKILKPHKLKHTQSKSRLGLKTSKRTQTHIVNWPKCVGKSKMQPHITGSENTHFIDSCSFRASEWRMWVFLPRHRRFLCVPTS